MKLCHIGASEKRTIEKNMDVYQSMSIDAYDYDNRFRIRPLRVSERHEAEKHVDLLYMKTEKEF